MLDHFATEFLAETNENVKAVVEARTPNEVIAAISKISPVEAMCILPVTNIFNDEFTDSVQLLTGDLSLIVLAGCDDDFFVFKYDEHEGEWIRDIRFGVLGRITRKRLDKISEATEDLILRCDAYIRGVKGVKEVIGWYHSDAVKVSRIVGFERALEMFIWAIKRNEGIRVVKANKSWSNTLGVVTLERRDRRFRVGKKKVKRD